MKIRQFMEPACPACGRGAGQLCINTRTGEPIQRPHPGRGAVVEAAFRAEIAYLRDEFAADCWDWGYNAAIDSVANGSSPVNPLRYQGFDAGDPQ